MSRRLPPVALRARRPRCAGAREPCWRRCGTGPAAWRCAKAEDRAADVTGRPLVSVVLPCFNAERFLPAALDSLLRQTYRDLEILAVDDGSRDDTPRILEAYAGRDPRVRVLTNDSNLGLVPTLNRGVAEARGDFIARMDADDVSASAAHRTPGRDPLSSTRDRRRCHGHRTDGRAGTADSASGAGALPGAGGGAVHGALRHPARPCDALGAGLSDEGASVRSYRRQPAHRGLRTVHPHARRGGGLSESRRAIGGGAGQARKAYPGATKRSRWPTSSPVPGVIWSRRLAVAPPQTSTRSS